MSVADFLGNDEFTQLLSDCINYPSRTLEHPPIIVSSQCKNPSLVGTAFEFLFQFELLKYYVKTSPRFSLNKSSMILGNMNLRISDSVLQIKEGQALPRELKIIRYVWPSSLGVAMENRSIDTDLRTQMRKVYGSAANVFQKYERHILDDDYPEQSENLTNKMCIPALKLAKLEAFYRSGILTPNLNLIDEADLLDLKALIHSIDYTKFNATKYCLISPYFVYDTNSIRGFDADLVLDNTLIDIKTTKHSRLTKKHIHQLIVYYLLSRVFRFEAYPKSQRIEKLAIYYARYDLFRIFNVRDLLSIQNETKLKKWIKLEFTPII